MHEIDWLSAVLILAAAAAFGLGFLAWSRRAEKTREPAPPGRAGAKNPSHSGVRAPSGGDSRELADLEARRDSLVARLQELSDTGGKQEPGQVARERAALELETAGVLREIDRLRREAPGLAAEAVGAGPVPGGGAMAARPELRGFLWGVGSTVMVVVLLGVLYQTMGERAEGGSLTGTIPTPSETGTFGNQGPAQGGGSDAQLQALAAAVERQPEDLDARLELAGALLMRQDLMEVFHQTEFVLERAPEHPTALSYQAIVRLAMGQLDLAEEMLLRALAHDADLMVGWIHLSLVYQNMGRMDDARSALEQARLRNPEHAAMLQQIERELESRP